MSFSQPTTFYDLNERAILAMYGRLTTNLNSYIDLVNAATAADSNRPQYAIPYPQSVLAAPPVAGQLSGFPIVALADGDMTFGDDTGWGATGLYEMAVLCYLMDADPTALAWKLRRYTQAIVSCAIFGTRNVNFGLYSGSWGVVLKRIVPGRRVVRQDPKGASEIIAWTAVVLELKDEQGV